MTRLHLPVLLASVVAAVALSGKAATGGAPREQPTAYTGARIIPVAGAEIANGTLVVLGGKIVAVGPASSVAVPAGAARVDLAGKVVMPGLVDTHSHIGGGSGGDSSAALHPDVRILDAIDARSPGFGRARAGGITTVNVMPGSGHLLSGQTVYLKLRTGDTLDDLLIRDAGGSPMGGIKMANGTNSIRPAPPFPGSRARSAALVRAQFVRAQEYREQVKRAAGDASKLPARDLGMEALVEVLEGRRIVHFHTHRHDDILTVLRLSREFGFRAVLHHVTEGWRVASEIAAAKVPSSIIVIDAPGGKLEAVELTLENGARMTAAGAEVGFHTDDGITDSRLFLRSAALAVRAGMPREKALYAMTMAGARMLDLQDRTGTLEAGKDADFIVLSGDPLSVYTHVLRTYVEGKLVFDRSRPADLLTATGGYGAGRDVSLHFDCYAEHGR